MDLSAETIANALDRCRKTGPSSWQACCPAHTEKTPSFSIKETADGTVLLHCFGGCSQEEVITALKRLGLWHEPKYRTSKPARIFTDSELAELFYAVDIAKNAPARPDLSITQAELNHAAECAGILKIYRFGEAELLRWVAVTANQLGQ